MLNRMKGNRILHHKVYSPVESDFTRYELTLDQGTLTIETPILMICDLNDRVIDISGLYGYMIDYNGQENDMYVVSLENGSKIYAGYFMDYSDTYGFMRYEPIDKNKVSYTMQFNRF